MVSLSNHVAFPLQQWGGFSDEIANPCIEYGVAMTSFEIV